MAEELGNGWTEGVHPNDFGFCLQTYTTSFDKREPFLMEYRMKNRFGEYRWIRDFGRPFYDLDNTFLGYIGSCYDITEIKDNELKLLELNASKDKFFSILAHDLRNPVGLIASIVTALAENIDENNIEIIKKQVNIVGNIANSTFDLLEELLLWARAQSDIIPYKPEKVSFVNICANIIENLMPIANGKNIALNLISDTNIEVYADTNMLKTIMRNLVSNAIKFTGKGGRVDIYAQPKERETTITVSDNGVGIEPANLAKLFDISKVYSSSGTEKERGSGLGLLLCKEFVEKHGGKIWAESKAGSGSLFKFTLPEIK